MFSGWITPIGFVLLLFAIQYWSGRRRRAQMQKLAAKLGFAYLGETLPKSLVMAGTEIGHATGISNVIDGERNGTRVVALDCRFGYGKGSWTRTVIAACAPREAFGTILLEPDLAIEETGGWTIQFEARRMGFNLTPLMDTDELEARIEAIGSVTTASTTWNTDRSRIGILRLRSG